MQNDVCVYNVLNICKKLILRDICISCRNCCYNSLLLIFFKILFFFPVCLEYTLWWLKMKKCTFLTWRKIVWFLRFIMQFVGAIQSHVLRVSILQCSGNITRNIPDLQQCNCKPKWTYLAFPFNWWSLSTYFTDSKPVCADGNSESLPFARWKKLKTCRYDYLVAHFSWIW